MHIHTIPNRNSRPAILLRESCREGSKVKKKTIANLSHWKPERIEALRRALRGEFDGIVGDAEPVNGAIFGTLFALKGVADRLGITKALGKGRWALLSLFLVLGRVAHQGSRLSAVRWAQNHAVEDVLGLGPFDEDDLYEALDWLAEHQESLEEKLYKAYVARRGTTPVLVLYDVTSSYFEGEHNELAEFGHNRDGKRGKKQVVIGLLTAADGEPLAVRVFRGNTADTTTVGEAIEVLSQRFGIEEVVFVGDRGMVKTKGKKLLGTEDFRYITALTDPQIRKLLKDKVIKPDLFDSVVHEVEHGGKRLVLRRNEEVRRKEAYRRGDKLTRLRTKIEERNAFVEESKRAKPEAGLRQLTEWVKRHKLGPFVTVQLEGARIRYEIDETAREEAALLDGCYVLDTDVAKEKLAAAHVDARYRDLQNVERDFRLMKTVLLEVRPFFLRKKGRTCGDVFAAMLALKVAREIHARLKDVYGTTDDDKMALTLEDAMTALGRLCFNVYDVNGQQVERLPRPNERQKEILEALGIRWPTANSSSATQRALPTPGGGV